MSRITSKSFTASSLSRIKTKGMNIVHSILSYPNKTSHSSETEDFPFKNHTAVFTKDPTELTSSDCLKKITELPLTGEDGLLTKLLLQYQPKNRLWKKGKTPENTYFVQKSIIEALKHFIPRIKGMNYNREVVENAIIAFALCPTWGKTEGNPQEYLTNILSAQSRCAKSYLTAKLFDKSKTILDLGAGLGGFGKSLIEEHGFPPENVTSLDTPHIGAETDYSRTQKENNVNTRGGLAGYKIFNKDKKFDIVNISNISLDTRNNTSNPEERLNRINTFLEQAKTMIKTDGSMIIGTAASDLYYLHGTPETNPLHIKGILSEHFESVEVVNLAEKCLDEYAEYASVGGQTAVLVCKNPKPKKKTKAESS